MNRPRERFVRWQKITLDQLSFFTYLLITFSVAETGFILKTMLDSPTLWSEWILVLTTVAIGSQLVSIAVGIWLAWNRLQDFRLTTQIAKKDEERKWVPNEERVEVKVLGNLSWKLLRVQVYSFLLSTCLAICVIAAIILSKPGQ